MPNRLPREFYRRSPVTVARALLGQRLVRVCNGVRTAGLIVETEAYLGIPDKAAHTSGGRRTARNESMWGDGGHCYVYFTYGMHHCMNVVTAEPGQPVAVLLRALEPVEGLNVMRARRFPRDNTPTSKLPTMLCSGPGKLCQAMAIDRTLDGTDLVESDTLFIERVRQRAYPATRIDVTPRIGIAYAEEWVDRPLRFLLKGSPHVSRTPGRRG